MGFYDEEDNKKNENKRGNNFSKNGSREGEFKVTRAKLPRGREVIGVIEERLGGNKMRVSCFDKKVRNCRVPGRLRRRLWLRPNDIVIIEPWELDDSRGDVLFKYPSNQIQWLRKNGYLDSGEDEF